MASKKDVDETEGFEVLHKRLEETVAKLEEGNLTLEESIALYEEGMKLARRSQELLAAAELRISHLQESFAAGSVVREDVEDYVPVPDEGDVSPE
jgi:exodeoxyribonuclease VII small subunit